MFRCLLITILGFCASLAHADDAVLADLAGRIEYAFYAQNSRDLQTAVQGMSQLKEAESAVLRLSWLNYGRWKLAEVLTTTQPAQAEQIAEQCANENWPDKLQADTQAISLALRAACNELLAELRPLRRVLYHRDRDRQIEQAVQLGGGVAQVMLVSAWLALRADDVNTAYARLRQGAMLYDEQEGSGRQRDDNWGQAELQYLLGKVDIQRRDMLAARNDLERALVIAGDYRDAAELLKTLTVK